MNFKVRGGDLDGKAVRAILEGKGPGDVRLNQGVSYEVRGAKEVGLDGVFDQEKDFADLHLDFPVSFGKYIMGRTPYMEAAGRAGVEKATFHRDRLQIINYQYKKYPKVAELIRMYVRGFYGPFKSKIRTQFGVKLRSEQKKDLNAALYKVIAEFILPFTLPDDSRFVVDHYTKTIIGLSEGKQAALAAFLQEIHDTQFLENLQKDCLNVYRPIFEAELPLRPALFLDVDQEYKAGAMAMRVSSNEFNTYKETYKDLLEVMNRQLVLVAGLNNIIKRGSHNEFAKGVRMSKDGRDLSPKSLNEYADISLGKKSLDLDDPWYRVDFASIDNELRNAIAHNKIDYDDVTQAIRYFPKLEGMAREKERKIQLLDYMWRMLVLFREVHRLHHLVKCLNYATLIDPIAGLIKK